MLSTPWGNADNQVKICEGFYFVSTASHGGFMISDEAFNALRLNRAALNYHPYGGYHNGFHCFEEDCEASIILLELYNHQPELARSITDPNGPVFVCSQIFPDKLCQSLSRYYPGYLKDTGQPIDCHSEADYLDQLRHDERRNAKDPDLIVSAVSLNDTLVKVTTADDQEYIVDGESYRIQRISGARCLELSKCKAALVNVKAVQQAESALS